MQSEGNSPVPQDSRALAKPRIVLVDWDSSYRMALAHYLRCRGYTVTDYQNSDAFAGSISPEVVADVVLLDDDNPVKSGIALAAQLRILGVRTPLALVTRVFEQPREELALAVGASDYFSRSRGLSVAESRLNLLANRSKLGHAQIDGGHILEIDDLGLQLECQRAFWRQQRVPLTVTEFRIVSMLAIHLGRYVCYRDIYDLVHGAGFQAGEGPTGFRGNVRSLIRRIRAKFVGMDSDFECIENEPGIGYRWRTAGDASPVKVSIGSTDTTV